MMACKHTHDGQFFKTRLDFEKRKLIELAELTERHLETDNTVPDDYQGLLRSAAGQSKLLVNEKFKQFEELIDIHMHPKPTGFPVQVEDLAGFWDLMMIEVQSLYKTFAKIAQMSRTNWKN